MSAKLEIPKTVNPDLKKERDKASFNVEEFAEWWNGGRDQLRLQREIFNELQKDIKDENHMIFYKSHEELYNDSVKEAIEVAQKLRQLQKERNPGGHDIWPAFSESGRGFVPAGSPYSVQFVMAVKALKSEGTDEQYEEFGRRVENFSVGATYAQTELGHGTFLRGLETRADYDPKTEEFILNSPTLTAYKWWPGGLGHSVNYCIVVANLFINNEPKGLHMFYVQVRDEETHMPMPGVDIGEIGHKMGLYGVNNGFLGLKNVRVPRTRMLMRNNKVLKDGTYIKGPVQVLTYFTMVYVRCSIVKYCAFHLTKAVTIATRYSAVRRQSPINPNEAEPQIIDHVTQQMKLFPELAYGIGYKIVFDSLWKLYVKTSEDIAKGKYERLPEMHAISCAMKVLVSYDAASGIDRLRMACGGHGYLSSSNLGYLFVTASAACTYEGENTVLLLQVGRFLLKTWKALLKGETLLPNVSYFKTVTQESDFGLWSGSWENIVKGIQYATVEKTRLAFEKYSRRVKAGETHEEASNHTGIELIQAAELFGRSFLCLTFLEEITGPNRAQRSPGFNRILENLLELFMVQMAFKYLNDLLRFTSIKEKDIQQLQNRLEDVLQKIRPEAVAICDGFDYQDRTLSSTLGSFDGNVYERLMIAAKNSPLNQKPVHKCFEQYMKPFFKSNL